jgi:hypothetical protein
VKAIEIETETAEGDHDPFEGLRHGTEQIRARTSEVIGHVSAIAGDVRPRAGQVAEQLPAVFGRVRSVGRRGVTSLQRVPDSRLRLAAAVAIGFGAGLRLAGARRLATLAGFAPASILGFAIVSRPHEARPRSRPARP